MSKQDTFNKLRYGVYAGMQIEHKFRGKQGDELANWYCTINRVDVTNNTLEVTITNGTSDRTHFEEWNMKHTVNGLNHGEYLEIRGE